MEVVDPEGSGGGGSGTCTVDDDDVVAGPYDVEFVPLLRTGDGLIIIIIIGSVPSVEHRSVVSTLLLAEEEDFMGG